MYVNAYIMSNYIGLFIYFNYLHRIALIVLNIFMCIFYFVEYVFVQFVSFVTAFAVQLTRIILLQYYISKFSSRFCSDLFNSYPNFASI